MTRAIAVAAIAGAAGLPAEAQPARGPAQSAQPIVEARNALELAMLDLKRLVNLPLQQPVRLTTELEIPIDAEADPMIPAAELLSQRAAVQAAERQVAAREQAVRAARAAYIPSVSLQVSYGASCLPARCSTSAARRASRTAARRSPCRCRFSPVCNEADVATARAHDPCV